MGAAADKLTGLVLADSRYDIPAHELYETQVAALDERLRERRDKIKLVGLRARDEGVSAIRGFEEAVPLLLPHTAYKSYPESYLTEGKWDRLTKWLGTVSTYPTDGVNLDGVGEIDEWVARLEEAGLFVSCSSGTTGKSAMLVASQADLDFTAEDGVAAFAWGSGVMPAQDRLVFGFGAIPYTPRNAAMGKALLAAMGLPGRDRFFYPVPPITVGSISTMIALRKAIADGDAKPADIAAYEEESARRQQAMDEAPGKAAEAVIAQRGEKLYISGMWGILYRVAEEVRARGYSAKDFHPENTIYVGGGLKRAQVPPNYREYVYETFNLAPERNYQMYGMQELGSSMPRCQKGGRYHVPPWLVCLPLDKEGDALMPGVGRGEVEGRAAFFDLSMDGRWGGVILGDHIHVLFEPCACGNASPSIRDDIYRYADLEGDDKIGCAGTVDAYVRGLS